MQNVVRLSIMQINYTTINHNARKELDLTWVEYGLADLIHNLSNNPDSSNRWCYASKKKLGEMLGVSERYVLKMIDNLITKGLIEKHEETKHLRTTKKWFTKAIIKDTEQSSPIMNKVHPDHEQSSPQHHEQSSYNKDIYNKDNTNNTTNVVLKAYGNGDINSCSEYFLLRMQIPKEDCTKEQSRRYWHLLIKESKTGIEGVKWLIDIAANDEYYKHNTSSSKDLYYKRTKLIMRVRGNRPKVATMPTEGGVVSEQEELASNNRAQSLLAVREGESVLLPSG